MKEFYVYLGKKRYLKNAIRYYGIINKWMIYPAIHKRDLSKYKLPESAIHPILKEIRYHKQYEIVFNYT
jgi:hypothetical protein